MAKIYVIGLGPGGMEELTPRAKRAIEDSEIIIGYKTYIDLIAPYFPSKLMLASPMKKEVERCRLVAEKALSGKTVALVSGGDSGIYGMAGIMLEVVNACNSQITVEIIPGITAASKAASLLGAPLTHDFAVISLSDLLTPWEIIAKRISLAAQADFVLCFYNPQSKNRKDYMRLAREILLQFKAKNTPVGIVRNGGRENESWVITDLEHLLEQKIDMFTTVIVGNSQTYVENGKMITPRGYVLKGQG